MPFFVQNHPPGNSANVKKTNNTFFESKGKRDFVKNTAPLKVEVAIDAKSCDVITLDKLIQKRILAKFSTLPELARDLADVILLMTQENDDVVEMAHLRRQEQILKQRIADIKCGFEYASYLMRTSKLVTEYELLSKESRKTNSFCSTQKIDPAVVSRKKEITQQFLRIAEEYIKLDNIQIKNVEKCCPECFDPNFASEKPDSTTITCKVCGLQLQLFDNSPSYRDAERTNMAPRYKYSPRHHFEEAMDRLECIGNIKITPAQIEKLRKILEPYISTKRLTIKILHDTLQENEFKDHYDEVRYIYCQLTGTPPIRISHLREELLEMFDQLTEAYNEIQQPDVDGPNSQNVNFKLYSLLQLLDFDCPREEWSFLKTPAKETEHKEKWKKQIDYLRKKYPNAKTSNGKLRWRHLNTF